MSRLFDGVDDIMVYNLGASGGVAGFTFGTVLLVLRIIPTADNTWLSFVEIEGSTPGDNRVSMGRRNTTNGDMYWANHSNLESTPGLPVTDSDNWVLVAVTKATGTVNATAHKIPIATGTRTSTAFTNTHANNTSVASGRIQIGGNEDPANIRLAVAAILPGIVLTTTQLDGIVTAKTTASIDALCDANSWLVDDSDAFANDLNGNHNRSSITGTADDADDPSGWVYGLGGGDATVTAVPATALADAPVGGVAVTANANVTAVPATALAGAPLGVISGAVAGTVVAVPATALASAPPANQMISSVVNAPAISVLASAPAGSLSSAGDATVTAVPATALADATLGVISAGSEVVGVASTALGDAPAGTLSSGATVAGVVSAARAEAPRAALSPAPPGGATGLIAVTFAEGT